jgi:hypothetical protein
MSSLKKDPIITLLNSFINPGYDESGEEGIYTDSFKMNDLKNDLKRILDRLNYT